MAYNSQKGFAMPLIIAIVALVLIIGGAAYFTTKESSPMDSTREDQTMMEDAEMEDMMEGEETMMDEDGDKMMEGEGMMGKYAGAVLAGKSSPLLDFKKTDYDEALKTDKLVVLYFYANWCPICKAEFPVMQNAFNGLATDKVIGFRVNYNDNDTDEEEKALARQFGVAYQHTKVFVKNNQRVLKSPEEWDKNRYQSEIKKFIGQ